LASKAKRFFNALNHSDNVFDDPQADVLEDEDDDTAKGKKQLTVTCTQFYRYQLFPRQGMPNVIFHSGKLHHVYAVDGWAVTEQNRLNWLRFNQSTLRADVYKGVVDTFSTGDHDLNDLGKRFILPSTHIGSTRHMFQLFQDSMAICRYYGNADLFITMTANPTWREIKDELNTGQTYAD
jgi:hypothetical protein